MNEVMTEQEQIAAIKQWFKENGSSILLGAAVVAASYSGWTFYQNKKASDMSAASSAYESYIDAADKAVQGELSDEDWQSVNYLADQLLESHDNSHYSVLAALSAAQIAVNKNELASAKERLEWAKQNASSRADQLLVDYRLALVEYGLGNKEQALSMLNTEQTSFKALYSEARGDIQYAEGDLDAALVSYQDALDNLPASQSNRSSSLEIKIKALSVDNSEIIAATELSEDSEQKADVSE